MITGPNNADKDWQRSLANIAKRGEDIAHCAVRCILISVFSIAVVYVNFLCLANFLVSLTVN